MRYAIARGLAVGMLMACRDVRFAPLVRPGEEVEELYSAPPPIELSGCAHEGGHDDVSQNASVPCDEGDDDALPEVEGFDHARMLGDGQELCKTGCLCLLKERRGPTEDEEATCALVKTLSDMQWTAAFFPPKDEECRDVKQLVKLQKEDEVCAELFERAAGPSPRGFFVREDGVLMLDDVNKNRKRIVVPQSLKAFVIRNYHGLPLTAHQGRDRVLDMMGSRFWWRGMTKDINRWIGCCLACRKRKTCRDRAAGVRRTMCSPYPWHTAAVDIMGGKRFVSSRGNVYIMTIIDTFSRWPICVPIRDKTPEVVAEALFENLLCVHGMPKRILSDRGREFLNAGITHMCEKWGVERIVTSPRNSTGNAHVERFHRWMNASMTMLQSKFGKEWDQYVNAACFAYRVSNNNATGYSPFQLMYGREPVLPLDNLFVRGEGDAFQSEDEWATDMGKRLAKAYDHVRAEQQRQADIRLNAAFGRPVEYQPNDWVLFSQPAQSAKSKDSEGQEEASEAANKNTEFWTGPHLVHRKVGVNTYDLRDGETWKVIERIHVNLLYPYSPWSKEELSTSGDIDRVRAWKIGGDIPEQALVLVRMEGGFSVGKLLRRDGEHLILQWYSGMAQSLTGGPYKPGWLRTDGCAVWTTEPKKTEGCHRCTPYKNTDSETVLTDADVLMHSFRLTKSHQLPAGVLRKALIDVGLAHLTDE